MRKIGNYQINFGTYSSGDYYPHFAWNRIFKCVPLLFGNLYLLKQLG